MLGRCPIGPPGLVRIDSALDCVLAASILATVPVPSFANSAMDGYALRSADVVDVPTELIVTEAVMAGSGPAGPIEPGRAVRIMTGAPMPEGADAVCMVEDTELAVGGGKVVIHTTPKRGGNVRQPGEDIVAGQKVFGPGTVLGPSHLGVLASIGIERVPTYPRLRVGVLSTGDELTGGGEPLGYGKIWDSNRQVLLAAARQAGCEVVDLGIAGDDERALTDVLLRGAERCDAIITSGGVSMGDRDMVKLVLGSITRGDMQWLQVAIKPAKPFAFGVLSDADIPVFGLPGNPVSAMVSFELLARPALRRMAGHEVIDRPLVAAVADGAMLRRRDGKIHFPRVVARWEHDGVMRVTPMAGQQSHQLWTTAEANGLAVLPDGDGFDAGARVEVLLLDSERAMGSPDSSAAFRALTEPMPLVGGLFP